MSRWFRFYDSALDDPKVQRLSADLFKSWVNLLCLASRHDGVLPPVEDTAFALRKSVNSTQDVIDELYAAGLLDATETGNAPHNWNIRQYKSDVSNERVKRHRERQRNVTCNGDVAPSESETEADTEQTVAKATEATPPTRTRGNDGKSGNRIPEGWRPSEAGRGYAADRGLDPEGTADAFCDWWLAETGPRAVKRDWDAAFRTWCRRQTQGSAGRVRPAATGGDAGAFARAAARMGGTDGDGF